MLTVRARLVAPAALRALRGTSGWTVLQVHPQACNLGDQGDQVLALVTEAVGPGPFSIVVELSEVGAGFIRYAQADSAVEFRGQVLVIGGELQVRLGGAAAWEPRPSWQALRGSGRLANWLGELAAALKSHAPLGSLAEGLEAMLQSERLTPGRWLPAAGNSVASAVLATAVEAGRHLSQALAAGDLPTAAAAAGRLAGLGEGLTPAGDDFLMGAMLALWSAADPAWSGPACQVLLEAAAPRTHRISRAWLRAAAVGEAAEAWHELIQMVIRDDAPSLRRVVARIARQGHTSGADALTGFLVTAMKKAPAIGAR
jgi:hypothetical protein